MGILTFIRHGLLSEDQDHTCTKWPKIKASEMMHS